jgi:cysteinyl-tRNA synthetase
MNLLEFRRKMESYRRLVDKESETLKDAFVALEKLHALYEKLEKEERSFADQVVSEWVLSEDEGRRFDALTLVEDFKIRSAIDALHLLARRLKISPAPGAPYELQKVNRILCNLRTGW